MQATFRKDAQDSTDGVGFGLVLFSGSVGTCSISIPTRHKLVDVCSRVWIGWSALYISITICIPLAEFVITSCYWRWSSDVIPCMDFPWNRKQSWFGFEGGKESIANCPGSGTNDWNSSIIGC
ncbi:hypothetical protein Y032_0050g1999 [Ancylostoma ceylanicum]|uniref:Uncharacterized protein n=1 Tax=Ancylostoma ceylanicum TaxID=53326 RepID=A0A016U8I5_9BILA|nr:hypothetical protein Y032_0050g1999 [Ancylostoma ceylanicum]